MSKAAKPAKKGPADASAKTGTFIYPNLSRYEGQYTEEAGGPVRNGFGKFSDKESGAVYTGEWVNDKMTGRGKLEFPSGAVYDGTWKDGKYDGNGTYEWSDGSKYVGDWVNNRMQGSGSYIDAQSQEWVGKFAKGRAEGLYNILC